MLSVDKRHLKIKSDLGDLYQLGSVDYAKAWDAKLSFTITAQDASNNTLKTYSIELITDEKAPEKTYFLDYTALEGKVTKFLMSTVTFTGSLVSLASPTNIKPRIVIDQDDQVSYNTQSKYSYAEIIPSNLNAAKIVNTTSSEVIGATFSWTLQSPKQYFKEFDLEILKVEPDQTGAITLDWNKASSIEIVSDAISKTTNGSGLTVFNYPMVLAEGTGYYFWRVRPIGNYYPGGRADFRNYGTWTNAPSVSGLYSISGTTYSASKQNNLNTANSINGYYFYYTQFNDLINWSYSKVLTEGGRQSESMVFANGLRQVKQQQTKLFSTNQVIGVQNVYDYSGRPALKSLPAPVNNSFLGYKNNFFYNSSNKDYSAADFDDDVKIYSPSALSTGVGTPNSYYSDVNTTGFMGGYVPSAGGYPFLRDLFYRDATGRIYKQSAPGPEMRLKDGVDSRNIKTYYSAVAPEELIRVFGNEAPIDTTVYKVITSDPNKVNSVQYIGQNGKVLATCLSNSSATPNLDDIGNESSVTVTHTLDKSKSYSDNVSRQATSIAIDVPTQEIILDYEIDVKKFGLGCDDICWECDYKVEIEIKNTQYPQDPAKNVLISFNQFPDQIANSCSSSRSIILTNIPANEINLTCAGQTTVHGNFSNFKTTKKITLPEGSYTVEKRVYANNVNSAVANTNKETFLDQRISDLKKKREDWTASSNCCGPISVDLSKWSCDEDFYTDYCNPDNVNKIADLIAEYVNKEQAITLSSFVATLETPDLLENGTTYPLFTNISNTRDLTVAYSGKRSAKLTGGMAGPTITGIPVKHGDIYTASVFAYYTGALPTANLIIELFDGATKVKTFTNDGNTTGIPVTTSSLNTWSQIKLNSPIVIDLSSFANPSTATLKVRLFNASGSNTVWFDNLSIVGPEGKVTGGSTYKSRLQYAGANLLSNQYFTSGAPDLTKIRAFVSDMLTKGLTCKDIMDCFSKTGSIFMSNLAAMNNGQGPLYTIGADGFALTNPVQGYTFDYDYLKEAFTCLNYTIPLNGLKRSFYQNIGGKPASFSTLTPVYVDIDKFTSGGAKFQTTTFAENYVPSGAPSNIVGTANWGMVWEGQLLVPGNGSYTFTANADDAMRVYIDGKNLSTLDYWENAPSGAASRSQTITLSQGFHNLKIEYCNMTYTGSIKLTWQGPGVTSQVLGLTSVYQPGSADPCANYTNINVYNKCSGAAVSTSSILNIEIPCSSYTYTLPDERGLVEKNQIALNSYFIKDPNSSGYLPMYNYTVAQASAATCRSMLSITDQGNAQNLSSSDIQNRINQIQTKLIGECNNICDKKRGMFETAIDSYIIDLNAQYGKYSVDEEEWQTYEYLFPLTPKSCVIDYMVAQCKSQCNPESYFVDQSLIALAKTEASDPNYAANMQKFNDYVKNLSNKAYYDKLDQDKVALEQAMQQSAKFAPYKSDAANGYIQAGDVKEVQKDISQFISQALNRGVNYREVTGSYYNRTFGSYNVSPNWGVNSYPSTKYYVNQQVRDFAMHIPDGVDGNNQPQFKDKAFTAVVHTVWTQSCPSGACATDGSENTQDKWNDQLMEINITFLCPKSGQSYDASIAGFALRFDNSITGPVFNASSIVDIEKDLLKAYFDDAGLLHINLGPDLKNAIKNGGLNASSNVIHFYNCTLNDYSGALFFEYAVGAAGSSLTEKDYLWLQLKNPATNQQIYLFDEPLYWKPEYLGYPGGYHNLHNAIVNQINKAAGHHYQAEYLAAYNRIILKAPVGLIKGDQVGAIIEVGGTMPSTAFHDNYGNLSTPGMQRPGDMYNLIAQSYILPFSSYVKNTCDLKSVTQKSNCPYGYIPVGKNYPGISSSNFTFAGSAELHQNKIKLTGDYLPYDNHAGAAWSTTKKNLNQPFDMEFEVFLGCKDEKGADGIAFVLQNMGPNALGGSFHGIGYGEKKSVNEYNHNTGNYQTFPYEAPITPSLAIEFDTYDNNANYSHSDVLVSSDRAYDHISIVVNGNMLGPIATGPIQASSTSDNIEDCLPHRVRITWSGPSGNPANVLKVYFDGVLRATYANNLVASLFSGNSNVYWGWTGSTGGQSNTQWVRPAPSEGGCLACMKWVKPDEVITADETNIIINDCNSLKEEYVRNTVGDQLDKCLQAKISLLKENYKKACLTDLRDKLTLTYPLSYHHYTLYYYDRAGDLFKTVPPQGVDLMSATEISNVKDYRKTGMLPYTKLLPYHRLITTYTTNSLKQIISQSSPDAGDSNPDPDNNPYSPDDDNITKFWYNAAGQLILSQDPQQKVNSKYSYSKYDKLGRVIETGEITGFVPTFLAGYDEQIINQIWTNAGNFPNGISGVTKQEVVSNTYTVPANGITYNGMPQKNLRNRISVVAKDKVKTYFSYDPHGNVEWMIQELPEIGRKTIRYEYDLISNKVLKVYYQEGKPEQFIHRYEYDEDNRITKVYTSKDDQLWEKEANYKYYLHGPLARTEIGDDNIQGTDYVYTIEGYLKSINQPELLTISKDPGGDGSANTFLRDEFAMELGYYDGDYNRTGKNIGKGNSLDPYASVMTKANNSLYNGNISYIISSTRKGFNTSGQLSRYSALNIYRYDKLNRLKKSDLCDYTGYNGSWSSPSYNSYKETFNYDYNGNITSLIRRNMSGGIIDNLQYSYNQGAGGLLQNRLYHVHDGATFTSEGDIQGTTPFDYNSTPSTINNLNNYAYDLRGNLIKDVNEGITNITWNPYGKVNSVVKSGLTLQFVYDAMGNRVIKKELTGTQVKRATYYVRDASGNIMGVYGKNYDENTAKTNYSLDEIPIYGSSRIGQYNPELQVDNYSGYKDETSVINNSLSGSEGAEWLMTTSNGMRTLDFTSSGKVLSTNFETSADYRNPAIVLDGNNKLLLGAYCINGGTSWILIDKNKNRIPIPAGVNLPPLINNNGTPFFVRNPTDPDKYYFIFPPGPSGTTLREWNYIEVDAKDGKILSSAAQSLPGNHKFGFGMSVLTDANNNTRIYAYKQKDASKDVQIYSFDITSDGIGTPVLRSEVKRMDDYNISALCEMVTSSDNKKLALSLYVNTTLALSQDIVTWDLDPVSGELFNQKIYDVPSNTTPAGTPGNVLHVEYSQSSNYLYFTTNNSSASANVGRISVNDSNNSSLVDDFDNSRIATLAGSAGKLSVVSNPRQTTENPSANCASYTRTDQLYDWVKYNLPQKVNMYNKTIRLQVYDPNPPTNILINAQNIATLNANQWPNGIYGEYSAVTKTANAGKWQTLTFTVNTLNGTLSNNVDQLIIHFDPNSSAMNGKNLLFDKVEIINNSAVDNAGVPFYTASPGTGAIDIARTVEGKIIIGNGSASLSEITSPEAMTNALVAQGIQTGVATVSGSVYRSEFAKLVRASDFVMDICNTPVAKTELNHWIVSTESPSNGTSGATGLTFSGSSNPTVNPNTDDKALNLSHNVAVAEDQAGNEKLRFYVGETKEYNCPITVPPNVIPGLIGEYTNYQYGFFGEAFSKTVLTRLEPNINFNWGAESPDGPNGKVNKNDFTAWYIGYITIPATTEYTFYLNANKVAELYIDGNLQLSNNTIHPWYYDYYGWTFPQEISKKITLTAGDHAIKVFYKESDAVSSNKNASIQLLWQSSTISKQVVPASQFKTNNSTVETTLMYSKTGLIGEYFNNTIGVGKAVATRIDNQVNFTWQNNPAALGVYSDNFSVRWRGFIEIPQTGAYKFILNTDNTTDPILKIDGVVIATNATSSISLPNGATEYIYDKQTTGNLSSGSHTIEVFYKDGNEDATCKLSWEYGGNPRIIVPYTAFRPSTVTCNTKAIEHGLKAEYYNNYLLPSNDQTFIQSRTPDLTRIDKEVNFDLVYGSPNPGKYMPGIFTLETPLAPGVINWKLYMTRWTGQIYIPKDALYTFYLEANASKLYIDGVELTQMSYWGYGDPLERSQSKALSQGYHDIEIRYVDGDATSKVILKWSSPDISKRVISSDYLYASPRRVNHLSANGGAVELDAANEIKASNSTKSIFAKAPNDVDRYYLVTGKDGNLYYNTISFSNGTPAITSAEKNIPIKIANKGGNLMYDKDRNKYALAVYNDVYGEKRNKLFVAILNSQRIGLYACDILETGLGEAVLVKEFKDNYCDGACAEITSANNKIDLGEMHISPLGDKLALNIMAGEEVAYSNNVASRMEFFNLANAANGLSVTYDRSYILNKENRYVSGTNVRTSKGEILYATKTMSFDFSKDGNYIYYIEQACDAGQIENCHYSTGCPNSNCRKSILKRFNCSTYANWETVNPSFYYDKRYETELRRAVNGKFYMNNLYASAPTQSSLVTFTHNTTLATVTASLGTQSLSSGASAYGLPLQPYKVYKSCASINNNFVLAREIGKRSYELTDHLGNVRAVLSDMRIWKDLTSEGGNGDNLCTNNEMHTDVKAFTDYYAFGMPMPGRNYTRSGGKYRYGFNGKEKDTEWNSGQIYDYGFRIYDPRIAKFLSVDPLAPEYPWYTPYQFAGNTPIQAIDLDGLEEYHYIRTKDKDGKTVLTFSHEKDLVDIEWSFLNNGIPGLWYKTIKSQRKVYVVHQTDEFFYEGCECMKQYDEAVEYSSRDAANKATDEDFDITRADVMWRAMNQAWIAKNERMGFGSGRSPAYRRWAQPRQKYNYGKFNSNYMNHEAQIRLDLKIPSHWESKAENFGEGIKFYDPANPKYTHIRVSPGLYSSPFESSRVPNVKWSRDGSLLDVNGERIIKSDGHEQNKTPQGHIPYTQFQYK
ncbi:hypothetical protein MYP_2870 [Sporocytophaga myxococcoides]|uniref:PA14 domain-containing protein n=1 Tax=Sporocytophaga myxococcoides TaxID=153721 RepID=A0A098LF86_9BACT|nr:hypothetical protein MYP_2870 [Sporocytophaga myxococcoides]